MKKFVIIFFLFWLTAGSVLPASAAEAQSDLCNQFKGKTKIWWDGIELKPGQIGRLTIKKDTHLFKLDGEKRTYNRILKAGEFYRIYAFKPGLLSVGGGYYVDRDSNVTYQTPSKTKLQAVKCVNSPDLPKAEAAKPAPSKPEEEQESQNQNINFDGTNSTIHLTYGMDWNWWIYDKEKGISKTIPYDIKGGSAHMPASIIKTKDSFFVPVFDKNKSGVDHVYKIDINNPTSMTKVIENITLYGVSTYAINNKNLYYGVVNYEKDENGLEFWKSISIYRSNPDGSGKMLFKELPREYIYGGILNIDDDDLYIYFSDYSTQTAEIRKVSLKTGNISTLTVLDYEDRRIEGNGPFIVISKMEQYGNGVGPRTLSFMSRQGVELYSFKRNGLGSEYFVSEHNNKLYFADFVDNSIYEVNKKGEMKKIKTLDKNITIIDLDIKTNYVYYIEPANDRKVLKQKVLN